MNDEMLTDDLPSPPEGATSIDDTFDAELLKDVPKMGDAIPVGTYAFRLEKFTEEMRRGDPTASKESDQVDQPYFALQWTCQQEPHVGRKVFENVPWVRREDVRDANSQDSPRRAEARKIINNRMPRAKEIMEAAGFQPTGQFGFKAFLGTNPEMKLQLKLREKKGKDEQGKYTKSTGDWTNEVQKHVSLHRPA